MTTPTSATETPKAKLGAVLLVDDEKPLLELYAEALSPYFDVAVATSTKEAGYLLHKRVFKVVVSDHLMPGGNGLSFLVDAREEYPEMQRVLVTGYMKPEMLLRSVNEAALYRYLLKPVSLPELIKTVQEAAKLYDQATAGRA
ncbi:response regulator [Oleiharenicola lentus]|nr:response regulator [Oleiharenicola lentus]